MMVGLKLEIEQGVMEGHKCFAAIYDFLMARAEKTFMRAIRSEVVGKARGRTLEIGCGTGASFPYYPDPSAVTATEPDPFMLQRARRRARLMGIPLTIIRARAELLPFPDSSFDTVISVFVFCSVQDVRRSLAEVRRVLRSHGELRFYEHVRYDHRWGALAQDAVTPLWQWLGGGCHPNRDTPRLLEEAGFRIVRLEVFKLDPPVPPLLFIRPQVLGVARPV